VNVLIFGATGMVGQGVLRECLLDPGVTSVLTLGRAATGQQHPKLREIVHANLLDYSSLEPQLTGLDACYFCLGVTSAGKSEDEYRRITYDLTLAAATVLARLNPNMVFIYVSGMGTDSSEQGRVMWARVKGQTENALFRLPFRAAYAFRPAGIVPLHGIVSKTFVYRVSYSVLKPFLRFLEAKFPKYVTTTEKVGRAMLRVTREGAPRRVLENIDINRLA
jgi:uncharacterized protein YbjT (DUF2867 family)